MRAVVVDPGGRRVVLEERPVPVPGPGEALVRVRLAGICGTDLELMRGYMGYSGIPGHEFVGRVERCDSEPSWIGKRVVGEINAACGACRDCAAGCGRHCRTRTVLGILGRDGAMATHLVLPAANLHEVPPALGDEHAVFAEPVAAALEVLETARIRPSAEVLLMGDGRLAQAVGQVLLLTGCDLTVSGRHPAKLDLLRSRGARAVLEDDLEEGRRWDVVVEATGSPDGPAAAIARCKPMGTVCLKSTVAAGAGVPVVPTVVDEIRVVGSRCGPFAPALRLLASGRIEVAQLISGVWPLARAPEAFAFAQGREVLKVLLDASDKGQ